jgi:hypothetical protein
MKKTSKTHRNSNDDTISIAGKTLTRRIQQQQRHSPIVIRVGKGNTQKNIQLRVIIKVRTLGLLVQSCIANGNGAKRYSV